MLSLDYLLAQLQLPFCSLLLVYELCVAQLTFALLAQNTFAYTHLFFFFFFFFRFCCCLFVFGKHLKLKITITFNLAQPEAGNFCTATVNGFCLPSFVFILLSFSLVFAQHELCKKLQKLRSCAALLYLPLAQSCQVGSSNKSLTQRERERGLAEQRTQVCHLPVTPVAMANLWPAIKNSLSGK